MKIRSETVDLKDLAEQLYQNYKKNIPLYDLQVSCQIINDYLYDRLSKGQTVSVGHFGTWNPIYQQPSFIPMGDAHMLGRFQVVFTASKSVLEMTRRKNLEAAENVVDDSEDRMYSLDTQRRKRQLSERK